MSEELKPCCCGSTNLRPLSPYRVQSIQCRDCHVSLRAEDWNRVMGTHIPEGYKLVPIEPTEPMIDAWFDAPRDPDGQDWSEAYTAMIEAAE